MINIVLVEPEIHSNTGNIGRTCVATGSRLHLIEPLGFSLEDKYLRRAGMDYWRQLDLSVYPNLDALFETHPEAAAELWLATTKAPRDYSQAEFRDGCWIFFGKESAGLPEWFRLAHFDRCLRLPMREGIRSLNLANSVAVFCYEALRQMGFPGLQGTGEMAGMQQIPSPGTGTGTNTGINPM